MKVKLTLTVRGAVEVVVGAGAFATGAAFSGADGVDHCAGGFGATGAGLNELGCGGAFCACGAGGWVGFDAGGAACFCPHEGDGVGGVVDVMLSTGDGLAGAAQAGSFCADDGELEEGRTSPCGAAASERYGAGARCGLGGVDGGVDADCGVPVAADDFVLAVPGGAAFFHGSCEPWRPWPPARLMRVVSDCLTADLGVSGSFVSLSIFFDIVSSLSTLNGPCPR